MTQIIKEPTRVPTTSSSTLDVVVTTMPDKHIKTEVSSCGLSDHHLVYTVIGSQVPDQPSICRHYKSFNKAGFLYGLAESLDKLPDTVDCNFYWNILKNTIETVSNCHAPCKPHRVNARDNLWMKSEILSLMYQRDYIHSNAIKTKNNNKWNEYKLLRNKVVHSIANQQKIECKEDRRSNVKLTTEVVCGTVFVFSLFERLSHVSLQTTR